MLCLCTEYSGRRCVVKMCVVQKGARVLTCDKEEGGMYEVYDCVLCMSEGY